MSSLFSVDIFTYDFTCSNVLYQFQNLNKPIKRHQLILSHLKEFDKRLDEQDISQAAKEKLSRTTYMVLKHSISHEHYERLVHLAMKGVRLSKLFKSIFDVKRNMRHENAAKDMMILGNG